MADLFTAREMTLGKAPARIDLLGDKTKRPEPAQHIITFPGGAIELSRTSDGHYWAHILINRGWATDDTPGFHECIGEVIGSRLDTKTGVIDRLPLDEVDLSTAAERSQSDLFADECDGICGT